MYRYELDDRPRTPVYLATGIHRDTLKVAAPWPISVDLTGLYKD